MAQKMSAIIEVTRARRESKTVPYRSMAARSREIDKWNQEVHVPTEALLQAVHAATAQLDKEVAALAKLVKGLDRADRRAMAAYQEQLFKVNEAERDVINALDVAMGRPV